MLLAAFRTRYPEFSQVPDDLVQAHLDDAALSIDAAIWGARADVGQGLLAAHTLSLSPWGQGVKLSAKDGTTTYGTRYQQMVYDVAIGSGRLL